MKESEKENRYDKRSNKKKKKAEPTYISRYRTENNSLTQGNDHDHPALRHRRRQAATRRTATANGASLEEATHGDAAGVRETSGPSGFAEEVFPPVPVLHLPPRAAGDPVLPARVFRRRGSAIAATGVSGCAKRAPGCGPSG